MRLKLRNLVEEWNRADGLVISRLLDPGLKDTLLNEQDKGHARHVFANAFAKYADHAPAHAPSSEVAKVTCIRDVLISGLRESSSSTVAEHTEYLNTVTIVDYPLLDYWKNAAKFPVLRQMALDFLAVPASTVQSERENSKAKYVITDT